MMIDRLGPLDPIKNPGKAEKVAKAVRTEQTDTIEVSAQAKAQAEFHMAKTEALKAPEIREDRIAELKAKINDPNYFNKAVAEMVADGILKQLGL